MNAQMEQGQLSHYFDAGSLSRLINATCPNLSEELPLLGLPFDALIERLLATTTLSDNQFLERFESVLGLPLFMFSPSDVKVRFKTEQHAGDDEKHIIVQRADDPREYCLSSTPWNLDTNTGATSIKATQISPFYPIAYALPETISRYINLLEAQQGTGGDIALVVQELSLTTQHFEQKRETISDDAPAIVRFVDQIINQAQRSRASDIHINPQLSLPSTIRLRIDGECETWLEFPSAIHNAVVARIKILAGLDIAEKRLPQDGKITHHQAHDKIEIRVATLPTVAGESTVLRLISQSLELTLNDLPMIEADRSRMTRVLNKAHGLFLVVGPTGSGKTTTLHALLAELNDQSKSIWTIEDPVEITQIGINQIQTNTKINLNFANALRAFLRADPDIMLIGEMRDKETAQIAHEAALTGHLVLSTLHTNSACETVSRLRDLGVENMQIADTCIGVLAQRLVRCLCETCKRPYSLSPEELNTLNSVTSSALLPTELSLYRAVGCRVCRDTGYQGRIPIFELLTVHSTTRELIRKGASPQRVLKDARENGLSTLTEDASRKLRAGFIDFQQFIALCDAFGSEDQINSSITP